MLSANLPSSMYCSALDVTVPYEIRVVQLLE